MISIIICSVNKQRLQYLKQNIAETIGAEFEVIAFDNTTANKSISEVYNLCAEKARYNILCFAHEDILFNTQEWGTIIKKQLDSTDVGVIGFAGSTIRTNQITGWAEVNDYIRCHYIQHHKGSKRLDVRNPEQKTLSQVVTLDGMCLFVNCNVYQQYKFDNDTFDGFHCYDVDFCTAVAQTHKNYVCNEITIEHFSAGAYSKEWYKYAKKYNQKWSTKLPMYSTKPNSTETIHRDNQLATHTYIRTIIRYKLESKKQIRQIIKDNIKTYGFRPTGHIAIKYYVRYTLKHLLQ